jgi:hypothetical protein
VAAAHTDRAPRDGVRGEGTYSPELRLKLELVAADYAAVSSAFWAHPRLAELFADYLIRMHSIIRASVPLMEAARDRAEGLASSDPVAAGVAIYLAHHIREERHHDDWLLADLEAIGVRREQVLARMPSPTVAALVGSQYYWIYHYHPVALLGYIAVLEGTPPVADHVEGVIKTTGLPRDAFRTILKHADLDPHHRDGLDRALDALPLTPDQSATISISAFSTIRMLAQSLTETVDGWTRGRG